ncbi:MAG: ROK family protein [Actinomycetota bacterium]|nr:ROK family protein [Actinomycetota bacterium]
MASNGPATLAIDIGGTGLKASVLDPLGAMMADRVRVLTPYPLTPGRLVSTLAELVKPLPAYDRVSVGFPGVVRNGKVLTAPHFVAVAGPGSAVSPELRTAWSGFDLAGSLADTLGKPTKALNDADLQGAAVVAGVGLELVVTLGTGVGTGLYHDGELAPHLEISHHPFRKDETYDEQLGDVTRKRIGNKKWNRRVELAIETLNNLLLYDHLYIGGGNSRHIDFDLGPTGTVVDNTAGILGGIKLWGASAPVR